MTIPREALMAAKMCDGKSDKEVVRILYDALTYLTTDDKDVMELRKAILYRIRIYEFIMNLPAYQANRRSIARG